jgi:hypothetical protein
MVDLRNSVAPEEDFYTITVGNILQSELINVGTNALVSIQFFAPEDDPINRIFHSFSREVIFDLVEPQQGAVRRLSDNPKSILEMLELEIRKGEFASSKSIQMWFATLNQASPHIGSLVLKTLSEPLAGVPNSITAVFDTIKMDVEKVNDKTETDNDNGPE